MFYNKAVPHSPLFLCTSSDHLGSSVACIASTNFFIATPASNAKQLLEKRMSSLGSLTPRLPPTHSTLHQLPLPLLPLQYQPPLHFRHTIIALATLSLLFLIYLFAGLQCGCRRSARSRHGCPQPTPPRHNTSFRSLCSAGGCRTQSTGSSCCRQAGQFDLAHQTIITHH